MSLWNILPVFSGSTAFGAALAAQSVAGTGDVGLAVAVGLGLTLGALCIFAVRTVGTRIFDGRSGVELSRNTERMLRLVYLGALAWIVRSGFLAFNVTLMVVRLIAA